MEYYGETDIGCVRTTNQDNFRIESICDNVLLCVVCDGMGGTNGGNIASETAISVFVQNLRNSLCPSVTDKICDIGGLDIPSLLRDAVFSANRAVYTVSESTPELSHMGTTLVCALIIDGKCYIANVGDSRLYVCTKKEIVQETKDHSYVQMLVDMGQLTPEEAAVNPRRNILTMAVGTESEIEPSVSTRDFSEGETLMLCSDGLYNYVSPDSARSIITENNDIESAVGILISLAKKNGGGDNITTILIRK